MGVVGTHSPVASLFGWFYKAKQWKLPMLRGFPGPFPGALRQIPFKGSSGHVQILMGWDQIISVPLQASWRTPGTSLTSRGSWQKKIGPMASYRPETTTIECRSSIVTWFMCHTWYLHSLVHELHVEVVEVPHDLLQLQHLVAQQGCKRDPKCGT